MIRTNTKTNRMENKLQKFQPWSLHTPRSDEDPNSPLIRPKLTTSHSHPPELTTIVEAEDAQDEEEDDNDNDNENEKDGDNESGLINVIDEEAEMPALNIEDKTGNSDEQGSTAATSHISHIADHGTESTNNNNNNNSHNNDVNDITIDIAPTKQQRKKERRVQMIVDELQRWNEFLPLRGVSCYLASQIIEERDKEKQSKEKNKSEKKEETKEEAEASKKKKELYKAHSEIFWSSVKMLVQQPATILAGIEFGEHLLNNTIGRAEDLKISCKEDMNGLFNSVQFNHLGLWQLCQALTQMMGLNSNEYLHRKLKNFIIHITNACDLQSLVSFVCLFVFTFYFGLLFCV